MFQSTLQATLARFEKSRIESGPLPSGSAPFTSSDHFKLQKSVSKPKAKCWEHRISFESFHRTASTLKAAANTKSPLTMITLGTARPAPQYYPWESIAFWGVPADHFSEGNAIHSTAPMTCTKGGSAYDLSVALNYGYAAGSPQLLRFITEHIELIHNPPYDDWESCMTCGTTSAMEIVLRILCNRNDSILTEEYTYSGVIEATIPLGLNLVGVKMDEGGISPEDLDLTLHTWDFARGPKPCVLYTIPTGQNPTGTTQNIERRRAVYRIAEQHDLMIIEDDPYHLLQLRDAGGNLKDYLELLPRSYLSLDISGRVIRLDSTSKILAPGLRCGWITACSQIIQKFLNHTEFSTVSPSGPSQMMLYKLLDQTWGHEGFIHRLKALSLQYRRRRDILLEACAKYLPLCVCRWTIPAVGMFLWIHIDVSTHPTANQERFHEEQVSYVDIEDGIHTKAIENGVLVSKGSWFAAGKDQLPKVCFRLTFAAASESDLGQAVERFGRAVRTEFGLI